MHHFTKHEEAVIAICFRLRIFKQFSFSLLSLFFVSLVSVSESIGQVEETKAQAGRTDQPSEQSQFEFFEKQVRPILANHCYECHSASAKKIQAGLLLDSRARVLKGGDSGSAVLPGNADKSELIAAVRFESFEMPPKGKLPEADIQTLVQWVNLGAPWPVEPEPEEGDSKPIFDLAQRKTSHWIWQPPVSPNVPEVMNQVWAQQPLDLFVLSQLEAANLIPASPIDRNGLIRRLFFDLHGLPPSPADVEKLLQNPSESAVEEMVDSLLRSPRFGERWGRNWLDLVRYAESRGHEFDADTPNAHQYRDYVIRAFNADVPYDQFVREHIAGDLLEEPRINPDTGANESILGTGFWFMGEWVHSPVDIRKDETDRFDNMIDVMSKTFLGVTISCARCHDHKFDAISTKDYYALSGFLQGSAYRQVRFETIELERAIAAELETIDIDYEVRFRDAIHTAWTEHRTDWVEQRQKHPIPQQVMIPTLSPSASDSAVVVDYSSDTPNQLIQDGFSFRQSTTGSLGMVDASGKWVGQLDLYPSVKNSQFWNGLVNKREPPTNLRSRIESIPRPSRTFLTPTFEVKHGIVSCLVRGNGTIVACVDSHRLVEGPLHGETIQEIVSQDGSLRWVAMNLNRYQGHHIHIEFTPAENAVMEVIGVVDAEAPQTTVAYRSLESYPNGQSFESIVDTALEQWKNRDLRKSSRPESISAINWLLMQSGFAELDKITTQWLESRTSLRNKLPNESSLALAMIDCTGEDDRVLIRGSSASPGEVVPRRFLEAIDGDKPLETGGRSGRLQLAERINDPANPLTTRVIVNRVWHHLLGRGIVPTVDDFGVLGQRPSNQDLLDHLADWFVRNGRSIKGLVRYIVLSRTYQMSSQVSEQSLATDPKNLLWQHVSPKRLSGESIRDSLLTISGDLDETMYGPPVPIHLTSFMDGRGRPGINGPLDGNKRRSIYIATRRNFLSPFMTTFDTPSPFSTMGRRNVSNVPAQALILMNDPFVVERARRWAELAIRKIPASPSARIHWMYMTAFARPPKNEETDIAIQFVETQSRDRNIASEDIAIWADLAHAMINLKEFVFLR